MLWMAGEWLEGLGTVALLPQGFLQPWICQQVGMGRQHSRLLLVGVPAAAKGASP